ncbi:hypothetical protein FDP41_004954 [Naegleria fowleri]|uniref:Histidine kinase/HSP90-like ATPase domain-containing protein n=1 Tax=Naegleria fowleri TaxID=5763 RepID=A0A6A5BTM8_NAEFO|nr:uncharacterized protein FDP41_004954 [Naegleria fowleri]KAF0976279.1 hypothetical protein FDP41_004954 [Naegleria fowleri]CAG4717160.1 unnamed protein product [Naegleria fowleri]
MLNNGMKAIGRRVLSSRGIVATSASKSKACSAAAALVSMNHHKMFEKKNNFSTSQLFRNNSSDKKAAADEHEDVVAEEAEVNEDILKEEGIIRETEHIIGAKENKTFEAETKQLLHIVASALYTDKEVFIRELVSNASDALEKVRRLNQVSPDKVDDASKELNIQISVDDKNNIFIIQDSGIGMTKEELIKNIGTIAHSGSRAFVKQLKDSADRGDTGSNIIGQFGVGFYSTFMVADKVRIYTRSALKGQPGYCWESTGEGSYTICEAEGVARGTKIVIYLKKNDKEFSFKDTVQKIIQKYSNFVSYPILLNGSKVNTLDAIWLKNKNTVTPEEHREFYKYLSHFGGEPMYILHFNLDIPLNMNALFYVPDHHTESLGMGKMEPGVNVHSRRVLIRAKHPDILPDWLRFMKGVVDSEDLPLNISREHLQDSPLIQKIKSVLVKRITKFFGDMMKQDRDKYIAFYDKFNKFIKEGVVTDYMYKDEAAKLLLYESSALKKGEKTTLDEYISRMGSEQKTIYYLIAPNREYAEASPYYEVFKKKGIEVLFGYDGPDDFVFGSIGYFNGKELKAIDRAELEDEELQNEKTENELNEDQAKELCEWFQNSLKDRVSSVKISKRLSTTPAIIKNPENAALRLIRKVQNQDISLSPQQVEINPRHPIILKLYKAKQSNPDLALLVAEQVFDNALISAGLLDDPRSMVNRLQSLMETSLKNL